MKENIPLLSICIPTRNREFYCIEAIKDILKYPYDNYELVIQDNSDSDDIDNFVKAHPDNRLVYNHDKIRINSAINIDKSLSLGSGEYILLIGDDDTILPSAFNVVKWAKEKGYNVVSPQQVEAFLWNLDKGSKGGKLVLYKQNENSKVIRTKPLLKKLLRNGVLNYTMYDLPKVYHGLVKRSILDQIRSKYNGLAVQGLSPDISLAVAVALLYDENVIINKPISIAGSCPQSSTNLARHQCHEGQLSDMPHLYNRPEYKWHYLIPPFYCVETTWAESALHTISAVSDKPEAWYRFFNAPYLNALLAIKYPQLFSKTYHDTLQTSILLKLSLNIKQIKQKVITVIYAGYRRLIGRKEFTIKNSWEEVRVIYYNFINR